ncbi:LIC_11090 family protein [Leptospira ellinghausenii]|uniref:LIC_11090 family protein n=1 Tax=Leptospira ellinghausenii TaxID=1917822 RepID=UPI003F7595C5
MLVLVPFLGKILFLESGLFAQSLYQLSMVCHCNHNSESEVHHASGSTPKTRMTCHLKKTSSVHTCTCSKKKMATKIIQSQSMNPSYVNSIKFQNRILFDLLPIKTSISQNLPLGYSHLPDKPPRLLT